MSFSRFPLCHLGEDGGRSLHGQLSQADRRAELKTCCRFGEPLAVAALVNCLMVQMHDSLSGSVFSVGRIELMSDFFRELDDVDYRLGHLRLVGVCDILGLGSRWLGWFEARHRVPIPCAYASETVVLDSCCCCKYRKGQPLISSAAADTTDPFHIPRILTAGSWGEPRKPIKHYDLFVLVGLVKSLRLNSSPT